MAASVTKRYMVSLGSIKTELIFIDANDATALTSICTSMHRPLDCNIFEISHTDGTTNDSMTKSTTPLAVFQGFAINTMRLINVSAMANNKHYLLEVTGF
jgi:hypothetical protein